MRQNQSTPFRKQVFLRALLIQVLACCILGAILWGVIDFKAAYSALLGGLAAVIPNAYFTYKAFRYFGARSVNAVIQSFWAGEAGKTVLTAVLFAVLFIGVKPLNIGMVFVGYILVQITSASVLLLTKSFLKR